jgi:hypothetical protein
MTQSALSRRAQKECDAGEARRLYACAGRRGPILTSTWPGPGAGWGVSPKKSVRASPLPLRMITARIVMAEEDITVGGCEVCGIDV